MYFAADGRRQNFLQMICGQQQQNMMRCGEANWTFRINKQQLLREFGGERKTQISRHRFKKPTIKKDRLVLLELC